MTNLTDKWRKGELPEGYYYLKLNPDFEDRYCMAYNYGIDFDLFAKGFDIDEVLAPVPTFEEWQQLKEYERIVTSYYMKPIDYEIACETVNKLLDEKKGLRQENAQLKELLKECGHIIIAYSINNNTFTKEEIKNIISKIDQVLADNKIQANTVACNKIQEKNNAN